MTIASSDLEVLTGARDWLRAGHRVELVTVARTWGSSPRPAGSMAAVREDGAVVGSVSGGCIERELAESFVGKHETRALAHQVNDDEARRFGLSCGGRLELVFETLVDPEPLDVLISQIGARQRVCRSIVVGEPGASTAPAGKSDTFSYDGRTLRQIFGPGWQLVVIGAGQLSRYVTEFARTLDFDVIVCEPREPFRHAWQVGGVTPVDQLPDDVVLQHGRDARAAVLALTHDPALDDLALQEALPGDAFYVGALGSRRSHEKRCQRLVSLGMKETDLQRIHAPIGLDIGSRTSAEIAVSIVAELIATRAALV